MKTDTLGTKSFPSLGLQIKNPRGTGRERERERGSSLWGIGAERLLWGSKIKTISLRGNGTERFLSQARDQIVISLWGSSEDQALPCGIGSVIYFSDSLWGPGDELSRCLWAL